MNNNGYGYIDLGLPSDTLWATCNVGANKPSDYGLYFQFGDTQGYTAEQVGKGKGQKKFRWSDYKWNPTGDGKTFTKYTSTGAILELDDDAAHNYMNGDWHIPTTEQILELIANTTATWTQQNYVYGRLFTSNKDSSKSIFIPAAGYAWNGLIHAKDNEVDIWASMLNANIVTYGQGYSLRSNNFFLNYCYRDYGFSVRGVIG